MPKESHITNKVVDRLADFQRKLRGLASLVPARQLPLLTPATAFGPDIERFKDPRQALVSWRDKQVQWWSVSGLLKTSKDRPLAFEFSFFERRLQNDFLGPLPARWLRRRAFMAHFSITDLMNADVSQTYRCWTRGGWLRPQRRSSGFASESSFHLEINGWHFFAQESGPMSMSAYGETCSLHLELTPTKPLSYPAQSGYAEPDHDPARSFFYCSFSKISIRGRAILDGVLEELAGEGHLDHEKFSPGAFVASEVFQRIVVMLPNDRELVLLGSGEHYSGSIIEADGTARYLIADEIVVESAEYWTSPRSDVRYVMKRRIRIATANLYFDLRGSVSDQERDFGSGLSAYWMGAAIAKGMLDGNPFDAAATVLMSGHDTRSRVRLVEFLTTPTQHRKQ